MSQCIITYNIKPPYHTNFSQLCFTGKNVPLVHSSDQRWRQTLFILVTLKYPQSRDYIKLCGIFSRYFLEC